MKNVPGLIVLLVLIGCSFALAQEWKGTTTEVAGVPHVHNPEAPMLPDLALEGKPLWSVGGESEAEEELLGAIIEIVVDDNNNSYLLDTQLSEVKVFDPDGRYLRSLGREGDGPGEFRRPTAMFFNRTAGLGVIQPMPARIVMFDVASDSVEEMQLPVQGGFMSVTDVRNTGTNLLMAVTTTSFETGTTHLQGQLLCVSAGGEVMASVWDKSQEHGSTTVSIRSGSKELMPVYQAGHNDLVYISPHYDKYEIKVMDSGGGTVRVINRDYETRRRSDEEINEMQAAFERRTAGLPVTIEFKVDPADRDVREILVRDNGEVWVGSSRSMHEPPAGQFGFFEVFDPEGRYVRNVSVTVDYDRERDSVFLLKDRLYVVKEGISAIRNAFAGFGVPSPPKDDETGDLRPPEVLCYQVGYVVDG